ncbi:SDR family NAD(P)-dependent oxidoreductase [Ferruginibacter sp. HRS2-29]|uniref:SDR family NAD(P)-dependent oxidoreductase n=1 Tax=Ferruginibacter sp. HRS2-29 TaxID=2487334 RepID=UPI0020CB814E|nr:SDR family NAD(P)-dependent oxidoreductase [Ferruginibacter sp. HRS2-29]MCP9753296.1 SDR family NAD(P)-dependent oxidoreductase [Ferruginibacter sp. HRS2-29]
MTKTVLITGATSGIGKACAERFAKEKYNLILTGRRQERLDSIKAQLENEFSIHVFTCCFDVQDKKAVFDSIQALPAEWQEVHILINNAGLALGREAFDEADMDDWETMLHTNVDGLLYVSRAVLPLIKNTGEGHIINIGSIAGKEVYENGNVYCASKFAVDAITRSMRIDLLKHGIKVTGIHPGAVETEFSIVRYKGEETKANATYKGLTPLTGEDIADTIFYCASLPKHVCINDLVITPLQQASTYYFFRKD